MTEPLTADQETALRADLAADRWGSTPRWSSQSMLLVLATLDRERAEHAALREALAQIMDITKPLSVTMDGPRWMSGDKDIFGGGNREKVWRIADAALDEVKG